MQIVTELLQATQVLLDCVSALEMMLHQKPVVSSHYTSQDLTCVHRLAPSSTTVIASTVQLGALTAGLLSERRSNATLEAVHGQIQLLEQQMYAMQGDEAQALSTSEFLGIGLNGKLSSGRGQCTLGCPAVLRCNLEGCA